MEILTNTLAHISHVSLFGPNEKEVAKHVEQFSRCRLVLVLRFHWRELVAQNLIDQESESACKIRIWSSHVAGDDRRAADISADIVGGGAQERKLHSNFFVKLRVEIGIEKH